LWGNVLIRLATAPASGFVLSLAVPWLMGAVAFAYKDLTCPSELYFLGDGIWLACT
jgi:hypothetical protein